MGAVDVDGQIYEMRAGNPESGEPVRYWSPTGGQE